MRNLLWLTLFSLIAASFFSSCGDTKTYAKEVKAEKALISDFINRNGFEVVDKMPTDDDFLNNEKLYYKSTSGLYYRLEKASTRPANDTLVTGLKIDARYIEYSLEQKADTADYSSPQNYPYGSSFVYSTSASVPTGFLEAVGYMKRSETEAKLIIPHKIGFNTSNVTPYGYNLKIQFRKDAIPQ